MKIHHFFIEKPIGDSVTVELSNESLIHQLKNVFRFHEGDTVILLDNSGFQYVTQIVSLDRDGAEFHVVEKLKNLNVPVKDIYLFQSLVKKDTFEWVLEKGTELGINHFIPVLSERSEKKDLNTDRCAKIMKEASEQSGRGTLPELFEIAPLEQSLDKTELTYVAFDPTGEPFKKTLLTDVQKIGVLIGPEGGWTPRELELFREKGVKIYSLGTQVLRAETAAISAAALFLLQS